MQRFIQRIASIDIDALYTWTTLVVIPLFVLCPEFKSQVFVVYAFLFVLKVRKDGYTTCGLEVLFAVAVLGLAASALGAWDARVLKEVWRVARIISLPILMSQYRPVRDLHNKLAWIFAALAVYGLARFFVAPMVTGYSEREYCYLDFYMNSSLVAFSGYIFSLVTLIRQPGRWWKAAGTASLVVFAYLILLHGVRASYLVFLALTPCILLVEFKRRILVAGVILALGAGLFVCGLRILQPGLLNTAVERLRTIVDMNQGSNRGRLTFWKKAVEVFREHPVNGIGYKRFNRDHVKLPAEEHVWSFWHAHNEWLGMLAETGLIGTFAWLAFKLKLFLLFFRDRKTWLGAFMLYLFVVFECHNLFEVYLNERTAYIYMYLLFGLGLNQLLRREAPAPSAAASP
ncbi:MAG: O-antigen ligase family protein [Lentisphaerae bacterium]|nr:O-antigen ligase family protein [Lentisphaerota bacterium]